MATGASALQIVSQGTWCCRKPAAAALSISVAEIEWEGVRIVTCATPSSGNCRARGTDVHQKHCVAVVNVALVNASGALV